MYFLYKIYLAKMVVNLGFLRTRENVNNSLLSQQQLVELNYELVIEGPSFLTQKHGESFYSPIFASKSDPNIRWRLKIFPRGVDNQSKDQLSLYLERIVSEDDSSVTVNIKWLVTMNGKEIFSKPDEQQTLGLAPLPSHFGCDKVVKFNSLKQASNSCSDDKLSISCQLIYTI